MKHRMDAIPHPDVKPAIPPAAKLYNLTYRNQVIVNGVPRKQAYAMMQQKKRDRNFDKSKFEVKPHL